MKQDMISPRTGKHKQNQLGKSKKAMELRAKKIATAMLDGATQEQALISVGYSKRTARGQAAAILGNPVMQAAFSEILEQSGLTDAYIAVKHRELMEATRKQDGFDVPDYMARARGLDMVYKVKGRYVEKKEITGRDAGPIQVEKLESMTDQELYAILARCRRERGEDEDTARVTD